MAQSFSAGTNRRTLAEREEARQFSIVSGVDEDAIADDATSVVHLDEWRAPYEVVNEQLQAQGFPIAIPFGDNPPEVGDETADVHEAAVLDIRVAQLRRHLSRMTPLQRRVICMRWGVFGHKQYSLPEISQRTGLSVWTVRKLTDSGLRDLQMAFGVADDA
jgi:DNA-directed RNA polymerase specialized sigma24 family protein